MSGADDVVLDAVTLAASDVAASVAFYDAALAPLGLVRTQELVDEEEDPADGPLDIEAAGWGRPGERVVLWVVTAAPTTLGAHVRMRAADRLAVEEFYSAALDAGGGGHAAPRRWTPYRRGEFNAVVADPDGNLVEVVAPE